MEAFQTMRPNGGDNEGTDCLGGELSLAARDIEERLLARLAGRPSRRNRVCRIL